MLHNLHFACVYIDDLHIASTSMEKHVNFLKAKENGVAINSANMSLVNPILVF